MRWRAYEWGAASAQTPWPMLCRRSEWSGRAGKPGGGGKVGGARSGGDEEGGVF